MRLGGELGGTQQNEWIRIRRAIADVVAGPVGRARGDVGRRQKLRRAGEQEGRFVPRRGDAYAPAIVAGQRFDQ